MVVTCLVSSFIFAVSVYLFIYVLLDEQLSSDEKPAISVNDLKNKYERKSFDGDDFSPNKKPFSSSFREVSYFGYFGWQWR